MPGPFASLVRQHNQKTPILSSKIFTRAPDLYWPHPGKKGKRFACASVALCLSETAGFACCCFCHNCSQFDVDLIGTVLIPLRQLRGEATGLHPIQRKTAGKVAGNLVGNGVVE